MLDVVDAVCLSVFPLSVGGGIRSVADATDLRLAGAEKINANSAAVLNPGTSDCAEKIGNQNVVLSMDIRQTTPTKRMSIRL